MRTEAAHGRCYVIAYTPSHANTMAECSTATVDSIISAWRKLYTDVSKLEYVNYIQIFENKGAAMGCSNPHPHGQSWTLSYIPTLPATGLESMHMFADRKDVKDNAPRLSVDLLTFLTALPAHFVGLLLQCRWPTELVAVLRS